MCHFRAQAALPLTIVALLVATSLACSVTANPPPTLKPSATATLETVTDSTQLTKIMQDIVKDPKNYEVQPVTIVGYYRG